MCQKLVKEKLTLNTNQAQLCASPPTHPFIGGKSYSVSLPMLLQRQPTPSSQMTKMKVWEAENRKKKKYNSPSALQQGTLLGIESCLLSSGDFQE